MLKANAGGLLTGLKLSRKKLKSGRTSVYMLFRYRTPDGRILMQFAPLPPSDRELFISPAVYLKAKHLAVSIMKKAARAKATGVTHQLAMRRAIEKIRQEISIAALTAQADYVAAR